MAGATGAIAGAITGARAGAMLGPRAVEEAEADMTGAETEATGRLPGARAMTGPTTLAPWLE